MDVQVITRVALGRMASVGDLYNARTDTFSGISVFTGNIPEPSTRVGDPHTIQDCPSSNVRLATEDNFAKKFEMLDVNAELGVSLLAGLVTVEGSGQYLKDKSTTTRTVKSSLNYKIQTKDENLSIYNAKLSKLFSTKAIESGIGTHMVTGILWGANCILSCQYDNRDNRDVKEVKGKLSLQMEKLKNGLDVRGLAQADIGQGENDNSIRFEMRIFGDVVPTENLPTTFEGALDLMRKLPSLVKEFNMGKGRPIAYRLLPLSCLKKCLDINMCDMILKTINEASLTRVMHLFEELSMAQQEVNSFHQDVTDNLFCTRKEDVIKIQKLRNYMIIKETELRVKLSLLLPEVRCKVNDEDDIEKLILEFERVDTSPKYWESLQGKIAFVKSLIKEGATYVGAELESKNKFDNDRGCKLFVLFFKWEEEHKPRFIVNRNIFIQEMRKRTTGCKYYAVDWDFHPDLLPSNELSCVQIIHDGEAIVADLLEERKREIANAPAEANAGSSSTRDLSSTAAAQDRTASLSLTNFLTTSLLPSRNLTILTLGESGTGKSTWINAFANYITYSSLEEARCLTPRTVIPSSFKLWDSKKRNITVMTTGEEKNVFQLFHPSFQPYKFYSRDGDSDITFLNNPGIRPDLTEHEMYCLNKIKDPISGICVFINQEQLLKNSHVDSSLKVICNELRDAQPITMLCFTHSRSRQRAAATDLKSVLKENIPEASSFLDKVPCFYFDSEAYRYLAALQNGSPSPSFSKEEHDVFVNSWDKSVEEMKRLLTHVHGLEWQFTHNWQLNVTRDLLESDVESRARLV